MKKIFFSLFFLLISFWVKPVFAGSDVTITCNSSECIQNSTLPLFNETNIYPGFTASQKVFINNNRNASCYLYLKGVSEIPGILADKISLNIIGINNVFSLVNYPLISLLDQNISPIYLGEILKNSQYSYNWLTTLNLNADNNYADKSTNFSINFNFTCDDEPQSSSDHSGQVAGVSTSSGPVKCTNSYPLAPTNFTANADTSGNVVLGWTHTSSDHSGYLIAFGTSPGVYQYGAPDVGNVTNYTVKSLTPGAQYCFYVRSLNGCMPGDKTSEHCINSGSNIVASNTIPSGFQPGILGVTTEDQILNNNTTPTIDQSNGQTLGESQTNCQKHWLPLLFLVAFIINIIYVKHFSKFFNLTPFLISSLAFVIDWLLLKKYCCSITWLGQYFYIGNILSWIIPVAFKHKISRK